MRNHPNKSVLVLTIVLLLFVFGALACRGEEPKTERQQIWEGYYNAAAKQLYHAYQYDRGNASKDAKVWHGLLQVSYGDLKEDWWKLRTTEDKAGNITTVLRKRADNLLALEREHLKVQDPLLVQAIRENFRKDIAAGRWPLQPTIKAIIDEETVWGRGTPGYWKQSTENRKKADEWEAEMKNGTHKCFDPTCEDQSA